MIGQNESSGLLARKVIDPLTVRKVGDFGTVTRLGITKFLHRGVDDRREEGGLNVDQDMSEVETREATAKVTLGVRGDDVRESRGGDL
jgi:hypothetical protein